MGSNHKNKTIKKTKSRQNSSGSIVKTRSKTKKMIPVKCSPNPNKNKFSCYENDTLFKLRNLWNERHSDAPIKTNNPKQIWMELKNHMSNVCNKESCWLKQEFVDGKLDNALEESFAPVAPKKWKKNPNEWLSSMDILDVMKQYEKAYKCFEFIGPTPIDFDLKKMYGSCVWDELCNFNIENQIKNKKTKIGMIFNTDPHDKPGQHWISMFINIKKGKIFYFDSAGNQVPREIMVLTERIVKQGEQLNPPIYFHFDQNYPVEHQYGNTECGIYSLYFIVHMLEDKITGHYLKTHVLKDEYMQKFRKIYFNDSL